VNTQVSENLAKLPLVEAAKRLRQELKEDFPTKFSVRVDRYSLGESIDVRWTNGPASARIDPLLWKYQDIDRCEITGEILSGGNRYVHAQRNPSDESMQGIMDMVWNKFVEGTFQSRQDPRFMDEVWRTLRTTDLYEGKQPYTLTDEEIAAIEATERAKLPSKPKPPQPTIEQQERSLEAHIKAIQSSQAVIDGSGFHILTAEEKQEQAEKLRKEFLLRYIR